MICSFGRRYPNASAYLACDSPDLPERYEALVTGHATLRGLRLAWSCCSRDREKELQESHLVKASSNLQVLKLRQQEDDPVREQLYLEPGDQFPKPR